MSIVFRTYNPFPLFSEDYTKLRNFLILLDSHNYHYGRWDWMVTHSYLDKSGLGKIGLWEDSGELVGLATYDCSLGKAYLLTLKGYEYLKEEMLIYSKDALAKDNEFSVLVLDGDKGFSDIVASKGYIATTEKENDAVFYITDTNTDYTLPHGFAITSMDETFDLYKYGQVLWKGFNHEVNGEGKFVFSGEERYKAEFLRPNVNLNLKVAAVAPNGDFVSYCGMWYEPSLESALVEPVATDPAFRKMGLGRAVVLEAIKRCKELGAKRAYVGSSQQFYYSIGFRPYATSTWWKKH